MTFLQFCHKHFLTENEREQFKDFLGSVVKYDRAEGEWLSYFQSWMRLAKQKAAKK